MEFEGMGADGKYILGSQLDELAKYLREEVIPCRLSEVRNMVLHVLEILDIEITVR